MVDFVVCNLYLKKLFKDIRLLTTGSRIENKEKSEMVGRIRKKVNTRSLHVAEELL